jgi:hypothetical protein
MPEGTPDTPPQPEGPKPIELKPVEVVVKTKVLSEAEKTVKRQEYSNAYDKVDAVVEQLMASSSGDEKKAAEALHDRIGNNKYQLSPTAFDAANADGVRFADIQLADSYKALQDLIVNSSSDNKPQMIAAMEKIKMPLGWANAQINDYRIARREQVSAAGPQRVAAAPGKPSEKT